MDITGWIGILMNDIRYVLRQSLMKPVFTAVVVLSVAVGVGANTAIFSLINSVLLRNLPVRAPDGLVMFTSPGHPGWFSGLVENERGQISYPEFVELKQRLTTISGMFAADSRAREYQVRIGGGGQQETTRGPWSRRNISPYWAWIRRSGGFSALSMPQVRLRIPTWSSVTTSGSIASAGRPTFWVPPSNSAARFSP